MFGAWITAHFYNNLQEFSMARFLAWVLVAVFLLSMLGSLDASL